MPSPTVRQGHFSPREDNNLPTENTWICNLPNDTLANNGLVVFLQTNSSDSISSIVAKDSTGATVSTNFAQVANAPGGQAGFGWLATGIAAGIRQLIVTISPADQFVQLGAFEIAGLSTLVPASALSVASINATGITGTTISAGTFSGLTVGDFLLFYGFDEAGGPNSAYTKGSGWTKLGSNRVQGSFIQYKIAGSTSETASFTRAAGAATYDALAIAIKADATKGDATQARPGNTFVRYVQGQYAAPGAGAAFGLDFPCIGDCIYADIWQGDSAKSVSSVTDSLSNSWGSARVTRNVTNGQIEAWTPGHCSTSPDLTVTVTYSAVISTAASGMMIFKDVMGTASSAIGASASANGTQSSAGNLTTSGGSFPISPTGTGSVVMTAVILNSHAVNLLNGGTKWLSDICTYPSADGSDQQLYDCDGSGHYYNGSDLSSQTPVWATQNNTAGVGTWGATALELLAAPAAPPAPMLPPLPHAPRGMYAGGV